MAVKLEAGHEDIQSKIARAQNALHTPEVPAGLGLER